MQHPIFKAIARLEKFAHRWWYTPVVAFLAASDLFIVIIPTDALLISNVAVRPKKWISIAIVVSLGSALGSMALGWAIQRYGMGFLTAMGVTLEGPTWARAAEWVREYQGPALAAFGFGPFPLQPGVVLSALANVSPLKIFLWVGLGRIVKYLFFAWAATHAPTLLSKIWGIRKEVEVLKEVHKEIAVEKKG